MLAQAFRKRFALAVGLCVSALVAFPLAGQETPAAAPRKPEVETRESQAAMTPTTALQRLKEGNVRFVPNATT